MRIKGETYFWIVICIVMLVMIVSSVTMETWHSKLLPILVGIGTLILSAMVLVPQLRAGKTPAQEEGKGTSGGGEGRRYFLAGMWVGGFLPVTYVLGLNLATALFVLIYMKTHNTDWFRSTLYGVLTTAALYGIFQSVLQVDLPRGIVFTLFR